MPNAWDADIADVITGRKRWTVITADCLAVLPTIPAGSVDAVVTDPPYGINTKSDGDGKLNPWADMCNSALWYTAWISQCRQKIRPTGCLWSFLNWRSMTTFQKASCDTRWPIESLLVWDKGWIGPGGSRGLRPSYEMVALFASENFGIENRGLPDVQKFKWCGHKPSGHPAEKPASLCRWLIDAAVTGEDSVVLDVFAGSGSVGEAAVQAGHRFVGIELDEEWACFARRRIAEAANHLFAGSAT